MADRGLNTGRFNEYGEWERFGGARETETGPSPIPLLVLAVLLAILMLFGSYSGPHPRLPGPTAFPVSERR